MNHFFLKFVPYEGAEVEDTITEIYNEITNEKTLADRNVFIIWARQLNSLSAPKINIDRLTEIIGMIKNKEQPVLIYRLIDTAHEEELPKRDIKIYRGYNTGPR